MLYNKVTTSLYEKIIYIFLSSLLNFVSYILTAKEFNTKFTIINWLYRRFKSKLGLIKSLSYIITYFVIIFEVGLFTKDKEFTF